MNKAEESSRTCLGSILLATIVIIWIASGIVAIVIFAPLQNQIDEEEIVIHLEQLQSIANEFGGGSRSVDTGYNASVDYVVETLGKYDSYFDVRVQPFQIVSWESTGVPTLAMSAPFEDSFVYGSDFDLFTYSPNAAYGGPVFDAGAGCSDQDYAGFVNGSAALVVRGGCSFVEMNEVAERNNAAALLIYNSGSGAFRSRASTSTKIPVFGLNPNLVPLLTVENAEIQLESFGVNNIITTLNVLAETVGGDESRTIVIGSHLDSVPAGPGINDNGSGSAGNLAVAVHLARKRFRNKYKIRFAWWGAEELGLLGSRHYVNDLLANDQEEYMRIAACLNFDMIGSPNYERGIYNSSSGVEVREDIVAGSLMIQKKFEAYFDMHKLPFTLTPFNGRSDYGPFIEQGICASGLASGAEGIKTEAQRLVFGGLANAQFDPCYHQYCDTINNVDREILLQNTNAALYVLSALSTDTKFIDDIYFSNNRTSSVSTKSLSYFTDDK